MIDLVYAKKCVIPTTAANVLQSLHMAAAFAASGARVFFWPGVRGRKADQRNQKLSVALAGLGLDPSAAGDWAVLPANNRGVYGLRFRLALNTALISRPDALFYARDIGEAATLARVIRLLGLKRTLVFEMHEVVHRLSQNSIRAAELRRTEAHILDSASGIVVTNPRIECLIREDFGYKGQVLSQSNGFSPKMFPALDLFTATTPWPKPEEALNVVYVGRFHKGKGVENLIAAMEHLPETVSLLIIGGPDSGPGAMRVLAESVAPGRIKFTGALPQSEVADACAGSHIFVIPQDSEDYFSPLKLYEAMALGLPILATPLDVFSAHADRGLISLAPGTAPRDLASGIIALAGNPDLARCMREKALAAAEDATWQARAARVLEFCASLTER